jgi:hypothetical protein
MTLLSNSIAKILIQPATRNSRVWFSAFALAAFVNVGCSSGSQQTNGTNSAGNAGSSAVHGGGSSSAAGGGASATTGGHSTVGAGGRTGVGGSGVNGGGTDPGLGGDANLAGNSSAGGTTTVGGGSATAGSSGTGTTACDNGIDDDGDGLIDGFDPECTGPLDNDEGSFATGIPGDNSDPKWQDCFFDGNSGAGDDGCRYATGCLLGTLPATDPSCIVSDTCVKFCSRLTQNGCDCFGCCTVQEPGGTSVDIFEVATCSLDKLDDQTACPRCVKNTQCGNTCGECELCAGKTLADLPASCSPSTGSGGAGSGVGGANNAGGTSTTAGGTTAGGSGAGGGSGGTTQTCDGGEPICGPGLPSCSSAEYCSFGCCIAAIR